MVAWRAYFLRRGTGWPTGSFRVHICLVGAQPKLGWPVQLLGAGWPAFCMMLMRQWQAGRGGFAFVLHLSLLEGPQRRQGPPQTQVALISLPSLTLMAPRALGVWPGFQGRKEGTMRGPGSILKIRLALDWSEKCCAILCLPSPLKGL